jgi:hypothetical protein
MTASARIRSAINIFLAPTGFALAQTRFGVFVFRSPRGCQFILATATSRDLPIPR